jgi:hypothetical protein
MDCGVAERIQKRKKQTIPVLLLVKVMQCFNVTRVFLFLIFSDTKRWISVNFIVSTAADTRSSRFPLVVIAAK